MKRCLLGERNQRVTSGLLEFRITELLRQMGYTKRTTGPPKQWTFLGHSSEDSIHLGRHLHITSVSPSSNRMIMLHTWKFFSAQPFFAINLTRTSASSVSTSCSTQEVISSKAAKRTFQFASPKSVAILAGINSAARLSASSGVCLYLKLSRPPAGGGGGGLDFPPAAAGGGFLTAAGVEDVVGGPPDAESAVATGGPFLP